MDTLFSDIFSPELRTWVLTPLLIFVARLIDVTIGTMRIIFLSRGHRVLAPMLGFFEILIWLLAIRQVFAEVNNPAAFIAYAAGFAAGNYVGLRIEAKVALGMIAIRIITTEDSRDLISRMNERDFGVTVVAARGVSGEVQLIFTVVPRRRLEDAVQIIRELHPKAFISISDVRSVDEGIFPGSQQFRLGGRAFPGFIRKGM